MLQNIDILPIELLYKISTYLPYPYVANNTNRMNFFMLFPDVINYGPGIIMRINNKYDSTNGYRFAAYRKNSNDVTRVPILNLTLDSGCDINKVHSNVRKLIVENNPESNLARFAKLRTLKIYDHPVMPHNIIPHIRAMPYLETLRVSLTDTDAVSNGDKLCIKRLWTTNKNILKYFDKIHYLYYKNNDPFPDTNVQVKKLSTAGQITIEQINKLGTFIDNVHFKTLVYPLKTSCLSHIKRINYDMPFKDIKYFPNVQHVTTIHIMNNEVTIDNIKKMLQYKPKKIVCENIDHVKFKMITDYVTPKMLQGIRVVFHNMHKWQPILHADINYQGQQDLYENNMTHIGVRHIIIDDMNPTIHKKLCEDPDIIGFTIFDKKFNYNNVTYKVTPNSSN